MSAHSLAGAEARLYAILAEVISFPSDELAEVVASGLLASTVASLQNHLEWAPIVPLAHDHEPGPAANVLESEYICLFDVPDRVPTPLYTGVYAPRRRDAMEELLRMYRHFGLTVSDDAHDLPDFVPTVLEFVAFLSNGARSASDERRGSWERAQADVLERHLAPWAAQTADRLAKREALPFYQAVIQTIAVLAAARADDLRRRHPAGAAAIQGA